MQGIFDRHKVTSKANKAMFVTDTVASDSQKTKELPKFSFQELKQSKA